MLLEIIETELSVSTMHLLFALGLGVIFGIAAQISRFCLRRAIAGEDGPDGAGFAIWAMALVTAIASFQLASVYGFVELGDHRFLATELPVAAIAIGGLMFGSGMVLTRGCVSRLTVLSATGNLRALLVLLVFAIVAHATLKGVFAPLRVAIGGWTVQAPFASFAEMPILAASATALLAAAALFAAKRYHAKLRDLVLGVVIGLVCVTGWVGTSTLLYDEFEPLAIQSAAFTAPWSDTLFWSIASTAIPAGFGTGLVAGVLLGAFVSAAARRELQLISFDGPGQTLRYISGAALMGIGGVLAGGCTVGAGLSGSASLSLSALAALIAIITGAIATHHLLHRGLPEGATA